MQEFIWEIWDVQDATEGISENSYGHLYESFGFVNPGSWLEGGKETAKMQYSPGPLHAYELRRLTHRLICFPMENWIRCCGIDSAIHTLSLSCTRVLGFPLAHL